MYWQVSPAIKWNIFSGTALSGQIQEAKAKTEMAVNSYNNVVLNALQEVDNSMVAYKHSISEKDAYAVAYEQAQLTFDLALDLYKKGLIEFQNVLDAQRNLLSYEEAKVYMYNLYYDAVTAQIEHGYEFYDAYGQVTPFNAGTSVDTVMNTILQDIYEMIIPTFTADRKFSDSEMKQDIYSGIEINSTMYQYTYLLMCLYQCLHV